MRNGKLKLLHSDPGDEIFRKNGILHGCALTFMILECKEPYASDTSGEALSK